MSDIVKEVYTAKYLVRRHRMLMYNAMRQGKHLEVQSHLKAINEAKERILIKYQIILD